jgi:hypothetical protein
VPGVGALAFEPHRLPALWRALKVAAYITDALAIRQVLEHLGPSPPEKPPPEIRDVVRVPLDDEGREIELQPA